MRCPRCLNEDPSLFWKGSRGWYCRACIGFRRQLLDEERSIEENSPVPVDNELNLSFELTTAQKKVALALTEAVKSQDVLLYAVCGAGKTEMLLDMLQDCFANGKRAAIAIARRQVVLELAKRLQEYFPKALVTPVCAGYTDCLEGDLIVCTTHQLYRYYQTFDVLVLDEPDAFPYKGNRVLVGIAQTSCRGHRVYLTATPDAELENAVAQKQMRLLSVMQRPHSHPLPVPKCTTMPEPLALVSLALWLKRKEKSGRQALIFVPTIRRAVCYAKLFGRRFSVCCCTSKTVDKDQIIAAFRRQEKQFCFCTSILERGVTFGFIDVVVLRADHAVFDEAALVQIAGRAGRRKEDPAGEVRFYAARRKTKIDRCVKRLCAANRTLSVLPSNQTGNRSAAARVS